MDHTKPKINAILEVLAVFILVVLVFRAIQASPLGQWESRVLQRYYVEYALVLAIPLVLLALTRRSLADYGISFRNLKYHLKVVAISFIPVFVVSAALYFLGWDSWGHALLVSAIEVIVLLAMGWLLRRPAVGNVGMVSMLLLPMAGFHMLSLEAGLGEAASRLVYALLFVALGEEILFRGYIQSRLNEAFGCRYRFFGVSWGWGVIIASLLFGFWHILNPFNPFLGKFDLAWQWGLWTFFAGLILGYLRERTGSVLAPTILHGVINF